MTVGLGLAFGRCISKVSTLAGIGGVLVEKRRTVVTFGHGLAIGRCISKCQHSQRVEGSWLRNAEQLSLLDLRLVVASQKCQHDKDRGGPGRETQNRGHFWTWTWVWASHLKSVNMTKIEGVLVAKRRTVVAFGRAFGHRISTVPTFTKIGGGPGRETHDSRDVWTCVWWSHLKSVHIDKD